MEVQEQNNEWLTWRIMLTRGIDEPVHLLDIETPSCKNKTFANPNMTKIMKNDGSHVHILSFFIHSLGRDNVEDEVKAEFGQAMYVIQGE